MAPPSNFPTVPPPADPPGGDRPTDPAPPLDGPPQSVLTGDTLDLAMVALALSVETDVDILRAELAAAIEALSAVPAPEPYCREYTAIARNGRIRIEIKVQL